MLLEKEELSIASRWGWVVLRGVVAILFGLLAFSHPGAITLGLILTFGAYAFIGGISAIVSAARRERAGASWGALLAEGLLGIAVAVMAVLWPATSALAFIWVIGFWAVVTGVLEIATAIHMRKVIEHEWTLGLAGALSIAFGLLMLFRPVVGGLAIVWWLGAYAMVFGVLMVVLGFKLRGVNKQFERRGGLPLSGGTATRAT
jgi:uncharacterized membrane protein HdeD (DUF308 family)